MNEKFKELIREKLVERNLTINELAGLSGANRDPIYKYLKGETLGINSNALGKIFEALNINVTK